MIPQKKLDQMDPRLVPYALAFDAAMNDAGIDYLMGEVLRTKATQTAYYAQGRESLAEVNRLRKIAGLADLPAKENLYCITWTMNSRHLADEHGLSEAFDIVILKPGGARTYDTKFDRDQDSIPDYVEAAALGRMVGLDVGADFKRKDGTPRPDFPHYQLNEGGA